MKRGNPPQRKTPLKSSSSLARTSGLSRGSGIARKPAKPIARKPLLWRPEPPTAAKIEAKQLIMVRSDGLCEIGVTCSGGAYAVDPCHRIGQAQGGPWDAANLLAGCRSCHGHNHHYPEEARAHGWMVRRGLDFRTAPVFHAVHGWCVLDSTGGYRPTTERPSAA